MKRLLFLCFIVSVSLLNITEGEENSQSESEVIIQGIHCKKGSVETYKSGKLLFVASLLVLTSFGSYNTNYTARFTRPNSAKGGTSYSPKTLSAIVPTTFY